MLHFWHPTLYKVRMIHWGLRHLSWEVSLQFVQFNNFLLVLHQVVSPRVSTYMLAEKIRCFTVYLGIFVWSYVLMLFSNLRRISQIFARLVFNVRRLHLALKGQLNLVSFQKLLLPFLSKFSLILQSLHLELLHLVVFHFMLWNLFWENTFFISLFQPYIEQIMMLSYFCWAFRVYFNIIFITVFPFVHLSIVIIFSWRFLYSFFWFC